MTSSIKTSLKAVWLTWKRFQNPCSVVRTDNAMVVLYINYQAGTKSQEMFEWQLDAHFLSQEMPTCRADAIRSNAAILCPLRGKFTRTLRRVSWPVLRTERLFTFQRTSWTGQRQTLWAKVRWRTTGQRRMLFVPTVLVDKLAAHPTTQPLMQTLGLTPAYWHTCKGLDSRMSKCARHLCMQ